MKSGLGDSSQIPALCEQLLQRADAAGRWPTPVSDIVAAAGLREDADSPFSAEMLDKTPSHLKRAVALIRSKKIRGILDRRERVVAIDPSIENQSRQNFIRLHEVTHDILPWQAELAYADDDLRLSPTTNRLFERQANQGAAELLFQGERFADMASDYAIGFGAVGDLANAVGSSLRAALRQFAETHQGAVCGIVLEPSPIGGDELAYRRREVSQSSIWTDRFGNTWPATLSAQCYRFLELIGQSGAERGIDFTWPDANSAPVDIQVAVTRNRFCIMVLLWVPKRELFKKKRALKVAA